MSDTSGSLRLRIRTHRGTLRLLSHAALVELTPHLAAGTVTQAEALAEIIQRAWLFAGGAEPLEELQLFRAVWERCGLSEALIAALDEWLSNQRTGRTYEVPVGWGDLAPSCLERILRELLHAWSEADGAIVFVRDIEDPDILPATLLPFLLHERTTADQPLATTKNGEPGGIDLNDSIKLANDHARRKGWIGKTEQPCLELHTLPDPTDVKIGGGSGGLPVLIAHRFRHAGLRVPALRLGASGVLNSAGALSSVTESKQYATKHALFSALGVSTVILPEPMPGGWPSGVDITRQLDSLVTEFRQQYGEAVPPQLKGRLIDFRNHLDSKRSLFTGREWLFEKIELWQHDPDERLLLIVGDPGFGKSCIVAELLHRNPEQVIAHHCCVSDEIETLRPGRFVQSIAAMLAVSLPNYAKQLDTPAVAEALGNKRCEDDPAGAFSEGILNPIRSIAPPEDGIRYVVIDALDESFYYEGRVNIVEVLAGRIERMPTWLRVIATTRNEPTVLQRLSGFRTERLDVAETQNAADIVAFIRARLGTPELAGKLAKSGVSVGEVVSLLTERSAGNFLYVASALNAVQFDGDRFDQLRSLPPGLEGLYLRWVERVFGRHRGHAFDNASTLLEMIVAAREPLTAAESPCACGLDSEANVLQMQLQFTQFLSTRRRPNGEETFALHHKSFADWLSSPKHAFYVNRARGISRLAAYCAGVTDGLNVLPYYVRRNAIAHFVEMKDWDRAAACLSNLSFIAARTREHETFDLQSDYALVLWSLPEAQESNKIEEAQREDVARWVREITAYAAGWSARRRAEACNQPLPEEPSVPRPPRIVCRWSDDRISDEAYRICQTPTRFDKVRAFSHFVSANVLDLDTFGADEGFVIPFAFNTAPSGPVHQTGKLRVPALQSCALFRRWTAGAQYVPFPVALRVLNATGPACIAADGRRAVSVVADHDWLQSREAGTDLVIWDLELGKQLRILKGHSARVNAISMTPDGSRMVSTGEDRTLRVWDLESGRCLHQLCGHSLQVLAVSITPDGRRAISGGADNALRVWDLESGRCEQVIEAHANSIDSVSITPNGRLAVSIGWDSKLKLWSLETGQCLTVIELRSAQGGTVTGAVNISPDGCFAFSTGPNMTLRVWNLERSECVRELGGDFDGVKSLSVTPDGRRAISCGWRNNKLKVWDLDSGQCAQVLEGHSCSVELSITPDGRLALSGTDGALGIGSRDRSLRLWDLEKGQCLDAVEDYTLRVRALKATPDGKHAVSGGLDSTVRLWDLNTAECVKVFEGHSNSVVSVDITNDGRRILSWHHDPNNPYKRTLHVSDVESGRCLLVFWGLSELCITQDGRRGVSVSEFNALRVWNPQTLETWEISAHPDQQMSLSPEMEDHSTLRLWDLETGCCLRELERSSSGKAFSPSLTPDGQYAITSEGAWSLASGQCVLSFGGSIASITVTPDSRRIIGLGSPWKGLLRDPLEAASELMHEAVGGAAEEGDTTRFETRVIGWVWDLASATCVQVLSGTTTGNLARLTPEGRRLIVASGYELHVWNLDEGRCVHVLAGHSDFINDIAFTLDGRLVVSGSSDRTLRVWDLESGECLTVMVATEAVDAVFVARRATLWCALTARELLFLQSHNLPDEGPLICTAWRAIHSEVAAPGAAFVRPPCCGREFEVGVSTVHHIDAIGLHPPSAAFDDPTLVLPCPHCQTRLRVNPFFLDVRSLA